LSQDFRTNQLAGRRPADWAPPAVHNAAGDMISTPALDPLQTIGQVRCCEPQSHNSLPLRWLVSTTRSWACRYPPAMRLGSAHGGGARVFMLGDLRKAPNGKRLAETSNLCYPVTSNKVAGF